MQTTSPEDRARDRAHADTGLLWHIGAFVIINASFWLLDVVTDDRITWAFWITAFWGFALVFHLLAWLIDGRQVEERRAAKHLARARARDEVWSQPHDETAGSARG